MNKERRQQLYDAVSLLDDAIAVIQDVHAEEEEAFENLPEGLQGSQTGYNMQLAMESAIWRTQSLIFRAITVTMNFSHTSL